MESGIIPLARSRTSPPGNARRRGLFRNGDSVSAFLVLAVVITVVVFPFLSPKEGLCAEPSALEQSELSVGRNVGNYRLINQDGESLPFDRLKGRPVLISFMYIDCHGPCFLINQSIKNLLKDIDPAVADKLAVLSISVDNHNDDPSRLKEYGQDFSDDFSQWMFATTDDETLGLMVRDLGFSYEKKSGWIEHMNRLTLVGPDGVVVRHFYGVEYDPKEVGAAVADTLAGRSLKARLSDSLSSFLIYCSNYDPVTKTYRIDYFFLFSVLVQYLFVVATVAYIFRDRLSVFFSRFTRYGVRWANFQ